jgi:hypothetical protein
MKSITDRDDQNVVNAKYEQNRRFIADFRAKWATRRDSPEIKALRSSTAGSEGVSI